MRIKVAVAALLIIVCSSGIEQPTQAASLIKNVESSLDRINRQLCANMPSSKCKKFKAKSVHKVKPKASTAAPVDTPTKTVPQVPVAPAIVPRVAPPLPKLRPADLNTDTPVEAPKLSPIVPPPPIVKKPVPPAAVVPVIPSAPPAPAMAKPVSPAAVVPVTPPVPPIVAEPVTPLVPPSTSNQASACLAALAATGASFTPVAEPSTNSTCVIDTPVRINSLATKVGVVKLPDQPTVNCAYALKLSSFIDQRVQPLAQQSVGSAVAAFGTGPGFDCRGRNGDSSAKMSEHAHGDAVDIVNFKFANKSQILVKDALNVQSSSFAFLRDVRALACLDFTTVLGPGANKAHAEHFHIDLEARRGGFRVCE